MAYKSASAWCPRVVARDTIQYLWQLHLAQPHQYVVHKVRGIEPCLSQKKITMCFFLSRFAKPLTRSLNPEAEENRWQGQGQRWIWPSQWVGRLCSKRSTLVLTKLSAVVIVSCDLFSCLHRY